MPDNMQTVVFTKSWHTTFSGGHIGLLALGSVDNSQQSAVALENHKRQLEADLRQKYAGMTRADLLTMAELAAYKRYYRQFSKTYHVQLQLESVLHKGKSLPVVNPLVDACFAAELETHLLTASHDWDKLETPIVVDASTGEEQLQSMTGQSRQIKAGDMIMRDTQGVVCTIIYGQDQRTAVTKTTGRVLYVTYAPAGVSVEAVAAHHRVLLRNVRLVAADTAVMQQEIITARS